MSGYWNVWLQHYTIIFDLTMCSHGTLDDYNDDNFHNSAITIVFHDNNNIMMRSYSNIFSIENGILDADWSILKISSTDQSVSSIRVWFCSHSTTSLVLFCVVLFCSVFFSYRDNSIPYHWLISQWAEKFDFINAAVFQFLRSSGYVGLYWCALTSMRIDAFDNSFWGILA